jgi:hypothetical protein
MIHLSRTQVDAALPRIAKGLEQYLWLQNAASRADFFDDKTFRRRFNHFYRIRRGPEWQNAFYSVMSQAKTEHLSFEPILELLHKTTGRYEASFGSKLFATLNPSAPVIDSVVLNNLGLRLPSPSATERATKISEVHRTLARLYETFLATETGAYLITAFRSAYPNAVITKEKQLDFVLWQTRA